MPLAPGTLLGPYEILSPIGAGGMGEVYKARDAKLDRFVAVKVLPPHLTHHPEALGRFEREVKAVAALSHPNILAIHDFGTHEGATYAVMELLEGETLRLRLEAGAMPLRKAAELAAQIASGIAAAHGKGIIHRDLKPENLFITREGRVKLLDYGLAKQHGGLLSGSSSNPDLATQAMSGGLHTSDGTILGTVGYMSPEQVRGEPADPRSDIFSFGVVFFEMLTGRRAFLEATSAETLTAILKRDPMDALEETPLPAVADRILRHCLEKNPAERFQSASDLAFDLQSIAGATTSSSTHARAAARKDGWSAPWKAAALGGLLLLPAGFLLGRKGSGAAEPVLQRITFQRGTVETARFTPDGKTVVYSARWQGRDPAVFTIQPGTPESRALGMENTSLHAVSPSLELAVQRAPRLWYGTFTGRLARVPLNGGGARDIQPDIHRADWNSATGALVTVHPEESGWRLESPPGALLHQSVGMLDFPKASRDGKTIAVWENKITSGWSMYPDAGRIQLVEGAGKIRTLAEDFRCSGLAWSPDGSEVWATECLAGNMTRLWGITPKGRRRLIWSAPGFLALQDASVSGRVLLLVRQVQSAVLALPAGATREMDASVFDGSNATDLSPDGRTLVISEGGSGVGKDGAVFTRGMDGSSPVNLGKGQAYVLSPDGAFVAVTNIEGVSQLRLVPTGMGTSREIPLSGLEDVGNPAFLPDGRNIIFSARRGTEGSRHYMVPLAGGPPKPVTPEGTGEWSNQKTISPDGRWFAGNRDTPGGVVMSLHPLDEGSAVPVKGLTAADIPIRWTPDGKGFYVFNREGLPARIQRFDFATGKKTPVKEFSPQDPGGVSGVRSLVMTPDGRAFAFNIHRSLSDLYLVDGLK